MQQDREAQNAAVKQAKKRVAQEKSKLSVKGAEYSIAVEYYKTANTKFVSIHKKLYDEADDYKKRKDKFYKLNEIKKRTGTLPDAMQTEHDKLVNSFIITISLTYTLEEEMKKARTVLADATSKRQAIFNDIKHLDTEIKRLQIDVELQEAILRNM